MCARWRRLGVAVALVGACLTWRTGGTAWADTFGGDNSNGGGTATPSAICEASRYTAPASGTATSLGVTMTGGAAATSLVVAVWANSSSLPGARLATTTVQTVGIGAGETTYGSAVSFSVTSGTVYWLGICAASGGSATLKLATSATTAYYRTGMTSSAPDPFGSAVAWANYGLPVVVTYDPPTTTTTAAPTTTTTVAPTTTTTAPPTTTTTVPPMTTTTAPLVTQAAFHEGEQELLVGLALVIFFLAVHVVGSWGRRT